MLWRRGRAARPRVTFCAQPQPKFKQQASAAAPLARLASLSRQVATLCKLRKPRVAAAIMRS